MKLLCSFVIVCVFVFASAGFAGEPGEVVAPQNTVVGVRNVAPAPVAGFSPVAYAPYEVKVQYTPIQPQPGEFTYCTVLPYGCPDGAPCVKVDQSCGFIDGVFCVAGELVAAPFVVVGNVLSCFSCPHVACSTCSN